MKKRTTIMSQRKKLSKDAQVYSSQPIKHLYVHGLKSVLHRNADLGCINVVATVGVSFVPTRKINISGGVIYLGKMPTRSPIRPVHQSSALSVRLRIVMISPFLNPRSPSWSASNV